MFCRFCGKEIPEGGRCCINCGKEADTARGIAEAAQKLLDRSGFHKEAFEQIASIDLKKEEKGILSLSQDWQIPFVTYTEEE